MNFTACGFRKLLPTQSSQDTASIRLWLLRKPACLLPLAACAILSACGGGGGGSADTSADAVASAQTSPAAVAITESDAQEAQINQLLATQAQGAVVGNAGPSVKEAGPPPGTTPAVSLGNGQVAGVAMANGGLLFYCNDALIDGFDWFERLKGWFPSVIHTSHALTPTHQVIDMAYAQEGRMRFQNVVVPSAGSYTMTIRYAFASGLFGGINVRPMGVAVNGAVVTNAMHFPITHSFSVYQDASIPIPLNAGKNEIAIFNVSDHGVSRVDTLTLTRP